MIYTMKKLYIYALALGCALFTTTACSDEDEMAPGEWDAAENYANVAFEKSSASQELDPTESTTASIVVKRQNTSGTVTVPVTVLTNTDNVFVLQPLTFNDGEDEAVLNFTFDNAQVGVPYTLQVQIDDPNFVSQYSSGIVYTYTVTRVKWNDVGYFTVTADDQAKEYMVTDENGDPISCADLEVGTKVKGWVRYTEDFVGSGYGLPQLLHYPVRLQERDDQHGLYRILNAYSENFLYNDPGDWDDTKDYPIVFDASDPTKVFMTPAAFALGLAWSDGAFWTLHLGGHYHEQAEAAMAAGNSAEAEEKEAAATPYYGTLKNGVLTFPQKAFYMAEENYKDGDWSYYGNSNGNFQLIIDPDKNLYEAKPQTDFAFANEYNGIYTSALQGAERESMLQKGTCTTETDDCGERFQKEYGTLYRLVAPYAEGYDLYFTVNEKGVITIPAGYEIQPIGIKSINNKPVYATINGGASSFDAAEKRIQLVIEFTNNIEDGITFGSYTEEHNFKPNWVPYGEGSYTYGATEENPTPDPGYTISRRDDRNDIYRIEDWYYGTALEFTWNQETNICTVPEQGTTQILGNYGEVYVADIQTYTENPEAPASYYDPEENTFYFYMVYYVEAGEYAYGWESFELTSVESNVKPMFMARKSAFKGLKSAPWSRSAAIGKGFAKTKKTNWAGQKIDYKKRMVTPQPLKF